MRILLLSHGPSVHTRRWLDALRARGHDVSLLTAHAAPGIAAPVRVVGRPYPVPALRYLSALGAVRSELTRWKPDITVAHFLPNYGFLAALAGARPFVLACWGSDLLLNARRTPLHRLRARFVLRRADMVHVDAAMLGAAAVGLGAPPERVWTRPWGVDEEFLALGRAARGRVRRPGDPLRILWTRMLEPIYDPSTFLHALGLLRRRGVPFRAAIAGDGPLRPGLEAMARELEIAGDVRFEGFVPPERLRDLYRDADVYVSLSRSDSTSQSLLEAMAAGLFSIVSDIEGNREWIVHRREGYLVPPGDPDAVACAIAEARDDPGVPEMVARAFAAVEAGGRFRRTVDELEAKLAALAGERGAR